MKKELSAVLLAGAVCFRLSAGTPADSAFRTRWSSGVSPEKAWQSYPRPRLRRPLWQNLNGLWKYAVTSADTDRSDVSFEGEILVPFAIESTLSGVHRSFLPTDRLWYRKDFVLSPGFRGKRVILHFGAVDYECDVWLNGRHVGNHRGGNNPFSFDVTRFVRKGTQELELAVTDPTDTESIARGKQKLAPEGIWYTPVSGIWKTVWVEAVSREHITGIRAVTDIHAGTVRFEVSAIAGGGERLEVKVSDGEKVVASAVSGVRGRLEAVVPDPVLWSPQTPKLYGVTIAMKQGDRVLDEVSSYFAFRKVSVGTDEAGYRRICLNDRPVFQYGTLDQGWWPDGLLTPPTEEAMLSDMVRLKEMGFNTIRKHIKVEPELYYYYADSLGIMIWQDMVSGFASARAAEECVLPQEKEDWKAPAEHSAQWQGELFEMIDQLGFYPCITTWCVFNEGWGQHNTVEIVHKVMDYDKSRLVNGVTGWTDRGAGHLYDVHNYPFAAMELPENAGGRVSVLGEFGGFGLPLKGHLWNPEMRNWGYRNIDGGIDLIANYSGVVHDLETLVAQGLGAAVYTQTTDVEGEVNGLITYDREVIKMPVEMMHRLHDRLYKVKGAKADVLIPDGRDGRKHSGTVEADGRGMAAELPYDVVKAERIVSACEFDADGDYGHLSLWLNMSGKAEVFLNGRRVFSDEVSQTRHYLQYNLSDYSDCLRKGRNVLRVELEAAAGPFRFDYGLRAF